MNMIPEINHFKANPGLTFFTWSYGVTVKDYQLDRCPDVTK